jgi:uncharacterized protein
MGRIGKAYEVRFRTLLQAVRARRLEEGVARLVEQARRLSELEQIPPARAFQRVYENLAAKPAFRRPEPSGEPRRFWCDAGLGGLARWLRAAGYEALWQPDIQDDELLRQARGAGATILTTDSLLLERRLLREGVIPALWLAPTWGLREQLRQVFLEFALARRSPRCMACGGALREASKESLRERIPPRTYLWLDEYFLCSRCGKLFWRGTHWLNIQRELHNMTGGEPA